MKARRESDRRQMLVTLSAVNTASAFFVIVVLFLIARARSGVALAVSELLPIEPWTSLMMPVGLVYFLIALLLSGVVSFFLVLRIGKMFARSFARVPYTLLISMTLMFMVVLVFLFTGIWGLLVFGVAVCIGLIPVLWGVRRSHCMGVLLVPVILYFLSFLV
jgi:putative membrane protein